MALWSFRALLGEFGVALGVPKALWAAPGGVLNERARALEGSRERPETEKRDFGALLVFPEMLYVRL